MNEFGVICEIVPERQFGLILRPDDSACPFLFREFERQESPELWVPVEFQLAPHPYKTGREVAKRVCPIPLPQVQGKVVHIVPDKLKPGWPFGLILSLDNGDQAWLSGRFPETESLRVRDRVVCTCVPGQKNRQFVLAFASLSKGTHARLPTPVAAVAGRELPSLEPFAEVATEPTDAEQAPAPPQAPANQSIVAAYSQKGQRASKSLNDDAFLVWPIADGQIWLLAVADGISNPGEGWWASDKSMDLLWQTLPSFSAEALEKERSDPEMEALMRRWIDEIHRRFRLADKPGEYRDASSTLTFALVRGDRFHWAQCGDCRIYSLDLLKKQLSPVLGNKDLTTQRSTTTRITSHIAVHDRDWRPLIGTCPLQPRELLYLCSDGIVGGHRSLVKTNILKSLDYRHKDLQGAVEGLVRRIVDLGETDDLTLIAFFHGAS